MKNLSKVFTLIFVFQVCLVAYGQSVFDDGAIYTTWTKSIIISNSKDSLSVFAKYNPKIYSSKIEIKEGEETHVLDPREVYSLSYFDKNIGSFRIFKNVETPNGGEVFSEIFYEDNYFVIVRSAFYSRAPSLVNPLGKPTLDLGIMTINKKTKRPLKNSNKNTYIDAMIDKEEEIKKYIKENRLKMYVLPDEIKLFEYYSELKR